MREVRLKVKVPVEEGGRIRRPGRLRPDPTIFTSTQSATGMGPRSRHEPYHAHIVSVSWMGLWISGGQGSVSSIPDAPVPRSVPGLGIGLNEQEGGVKAGKEG